MRIHSPDALSINLLYDKFWIPKGGKYFVYTSDKRHSIGAFTNTNNRGDREDVQGFATGLLYGNDVTLEYYQPKEVTEEAIISVAYVIHGYKYISISDKIGYNDSGNCQININESEGNNWQNEKRAVALILVNGNRICTGSLINTTSANAEPLLLTADHCLGEWGDAITSPVLNHWTFYWNYELPSNPEDSHLEPLIYSTSGATVLANNSISDFALLRLIEDPKNIAGFFPYYLGWDCSGNSGSGGVCIHHPNGDVKKISTYSMSPVSTNYTNNSQNALGTHWKVNWISTINGHGTTERGSSGSPLLNNNHKIIGQLHGGFSNCSNPNEADWYGKTCVSWDGNGNLDARRRLKDWISPNSNLKVLDGSDVFFISAPSAICTTGTAHILNFPANCTVNWSVNNSCMQIISGQGTDSVTLQRNDDGWATLTATISYNGTVVKTLSKEIMVGTPAFCMNVIPVAADGSQGYWRSDLNGNSIDVEFVNSNAHYPNYVVDLYRIDNGFSVGTHLGHWVTTSLSDMTFNYYPQGWYYIEVVGVNDCGTSEAWGTELECVDGNDLQNRMFSFVYDQSSAMLTVTLNPASERSQKLSRNQSLSGSASAGNYEVQLWIENTLLRSYKATDAQLQIPMSGMKAGLYVVRAVKDGKTQQRKLIKK